MHFVRLGALFTELLSLAPVTLTASWRALRALALYGERDFYWVRSVGARDVFSCSASSRLVVTLPTLTVLKSDTPAGVENLVTWCVPGMTKCILQTPLPTDRRSPSTNSTVTYTESIVYEHPLVQLAQ